MSSHPDWAALRALFPTLQHKAYLASGSYGLLAKPVEAALRLYLHDRLEKGGRYEGDTLVVDTIGINDKTYIDNFRTPHTEKLHVVERFRMIDDGNMLEANIHIEDPGAFTMPWNAVQRWRRVKQGPMYERACAENPFDLHIQDTEPVPHADTPDF